MGSIMFIRWFALQKVYYSIVRGKVMRKHALGLYLLIRRLFQFTIVSLDCISTSKLKTNQVYK